MYRKFLFLSLLCFVLPVFAAKERNIEDEKYRRNSLGVMLDQSIMLSLSEDGVEEQISKYYNNFYLSDKFDPLPINLDRGATKFYVYDIHVTEDDMLRIDPDFKKKTEKNSNGFSSLFGPQMSEEERIANEKYNFMTSNPLVLSATTEQEYYINTVKKAAQLLKWMEQQNMANNLIMGWFQGTDRPGSPYSVSLLEERGIYSASELDKMEADETLRGQAIIKDAGEELIGHTFLAFTDFEITDVHNYELKMKQTSKDVFGDRSWFAKELQKSHDASASEDAGMYILATTYLFQLDWNDDISNHFYENYWNEPLSKLKNSKDFKMKYLGYIRHETNTIENVTGNNFFNRLGNQLKSDFQSGRLFEHANSKEEQKKLDEKHRQERNAENNEKRKEQTVLLTEQAMIRSIDQTYADLMKKHEQFKVKAPILEVENGYITAKIGKKEGVKDNSEFEVLLPYDDEETGKRTYRKVAKVKVDKKRIWDNRYTIVDDDTNIRKNKKETYTLDRTYFKCSDKNVAEGMLLIQVK